VRGDHSNVKIHAIAVRASHLDRSTAIVVSVFRGFIKGVDRPTAIVAVWPKVMGAYVTRGDGRVGRKRL
jgi:hypothetical protein